MVEEAGEENFFLFGLTAEQVSESGAWYNPRWHYDNEPETRAALDLIFLTISAEMNRVFSSPCATLFSPTAIAICILPISVPICGRTGSLKNCAPTPLPGRGRRF